MKKRKIIKKSKIKAVIFDVGGVLALEKYRKNPLKGHRTKGVHEYIAKKLKISLDQWFDSIDSTYADAIEGKITENRFVFVLAKNNKVTSKKISKLYKRAYKKHFKINKELYKFAFKLKKRGYKIALLSDQHYLSKKVLMPQKYIKKFNVSVVSCDVGIRKPDSKIYKLILKKLRVPAKNCLFIDNQAWNIKPAKKLGLQTVLFKNNEQTIKEIRKLGVIIQ